MLGDNPYFVMLEAMEKGETFIHFMKRDGKQVKVTVEVLAE